MKAREPGLPVLLITGYETLAQDGEQEIERLVKPFRSDELLARVEALLVDAAPVVGA